MRTRDTVETSQLLGREQRMRQDLIQRKRIAGGRLFNASAPETPTALQPNMANGIANRSSAPSVYRPQQLQVVSQAKLSASYAAPPQRPSIAPPAYRPNLQSVTQPKAMPAAQHRVPRFYSPQSKGAPTAPKTWQRSNVPPAPSQTQSLITGTGSLQSKPSAVVQRRCSICRMNWHHAGNCPYSPTVGSQLVGSFGSAFINNVPSNLGTFGVGAWLRGGNPRSRFMGGLFGLSANLLWGTADNYYQRTDRTSLLWHNRTGRE
jgi:hypothetical protein